ncbi:uncharacterized protein FOMMEDRAFT_155231 [Fomitiporia mediterranea MF3/22]|uniref:uncharacterized protein n=1 Tax=Fomitiporia mediterranea (strain MF3/22) TaxID=694068 RepID=UPI0004407BF2|nr:uncharacterized protein FOMMEDRAFT_155231 [Fomitiporia mediterranea MF3/22]EJD04101.1 hypothetical protein FOMMEDRAFT_155231 [Fomitiporia mediterranea MF3/22]
MASLLQSLGRQIIAFVSKMTGAGVIAFSSLPPIRRIVTGHDEKGNGTVKNDSAIPSRPAIGPGSEGLAGGSLWTTVVDGALRPIGGQGFVMRNGTNLRFTDLAPGASSPMHRTSSVDYNILIFGKLILVLDDGTEALIENPGDTVVQRGNMHAWRNPGPGVARWASVLVDAEPAVVNGATLDDAWLA